MSRFASIMVLEHCFPMPLPSSAADISALVSSLKGGGYVIVRHGATDDSQKDVFTLSNSMTWPLSASQRSGAEWLVNLAQPLTAVCRGRGLPAD